MTINASGTSQSSMGYGALQGTYPRTPFWKQFIFWFSLLLLGLGALIVAAIQQRSIAGILFTGASLLGGIACLVWIVKDLKHRILLYAFGVRILDGDKPVFEATWPDVAYLQEQREGQTEADFCGLTLHHRNGSQFRIFEFENFQFLKQTICRKVYEVIRADTMAAFKRGEAVDFKGLMLRSNGVETEGRIVPWEKIVVSYGTVEMIVSELPRKRKIWSLPVGAIPNFTVVLEIFNAAGIET